MDTIKPITDALTIECNLVDSLITLLQEEQSILTTRNFDAMEKHAEKKDIIVKQLEKSAEDRLSKMGITSGENLNAQVSSFINTLNARDKSAIKTLNDSLKDKLKLCHDLNLVIGQVLATNIQTRTDIVRALSGHDIEQAIDTYSSTGNIKDDAQSIRHEEA